MDPNCWRFSRSMWILINHSINQRWGYGTTIKHGAVKHDCFKSFNECFAFVSGRPVYEEWVTYCGFKTLVSVFQFSIQIFTRCFYIYSYRIHIYY